jgi:hypothetical protein
VFYDVPSGFTIAMPCAKGKPDCNFTTPGDAVGVLSGYPTSSGYDLATGLGSVNAANLIKNWKSFPLTASMTTLTLTPPTGSTLTTLTHGQSVGVNIHVAPQTGGEPPTPSGNVSLIANTGPDGTEGVQGFILNGGVASGSTTSLPGGSYTVFAQYAGDGTFGSSLFSPGIPVKVSAEASQPNIALELFDPTGAQTNANATTATYGSLEILRMNVTSKSGDACAQNAPGATGCPTGSVTITNNGAALDAGTYALNSQGYAEDTAVQLPGGTNNLTLAYSGDNSYQPSTGAHSIAVTQVATSIGQTLTVTSPVVGTPFYATVIGYSKAIRGVAPTGTVTFYDGKTQIGSSGPISGEPAGYAPQFFANGTLTVVSGGARTISAQYSGDGNYAASTTSTTVNALYPATASISVSPSTVNYGASVTIIGVIDTAIPATNAALKPTGTVLVGAPLGGNNISPVTTATNADANGNWQIQVSATAIPSGSEAFNLNYSGDSNYAPVTASGNMVTVNIPDFSLGPAAGITIAPLAGQSARTQVTVTPLSQTPSPVTLSVYPAISISGYKIAITPQTINLNGAPATATISLTPTATAPTNSIRSQVRLESLIETGRSVYWPLSAATGLAALFLIAIPRRRRKFRAALGLTTFCVVLFVLGCGGGSSPSGGGGSSGPQPTTITLSTLSAKIAQRTPLPITATVTSASGNVITGNVTFYNFGAPFGSGYSIVNGQYTFQGDVGELGIYQVTASYSGDGNNLPSTTSSPLIQMVTGSVPVTITGNTGADSHSLPATIGLQ